MFRYPRAADASTSLRAHHQRCTSEPSTSTTSVAVQTTRTSARQGTVTAGAARQQTGATKTTVVSGRYQKNRSSSTLDRDTKAAAASKPSLSSTLQQIGDWARRSFRGHGGGRKGAVGGRPKSLNDYVMTEVSSGVVVERKADKLFSAAASRDQSPVTTSSGYASGADGIYARLHDDDDFEDAEGRRLEQQVRRGASRGSRRYRRRASMHAAVQPPSSPPEEPVRPPSATFPAANEKCGGIRLPVYENLLSEALGLKCETMADSIPASRAQYHPNLTRRIDNLQHGDRVNPEVDPQPKPLTAEAVMDTGNGSLDDYLHPAERSSFVASSDSSTLRRTGSKASPVYVNGNLLMTSLNQSCGWRQNGAERRSRSRSLSSSRNRTLTNDQSTTANFAGVPQRLSFTPSFVAPSPSPLPDAADADWDDRLSTLSLGCRRPPVSPGHRDTAQRLGPRQPRTKSARRRLLFGGHAATSVDRRPEAVEECVRPLFKQAGPPPTISNVAARSPPARLFPGLGDTEESIYETIGEIAGRSGLPVSRVCGVGPEVVDSEHVYDNIDDIVAATVAASSATDIHDLPPPLPPPPLPARRPTAGHEMPLCRSEVVELDSHHVYTVADVLDSFEALAAHLPRAQQFIYDLQTAAYLHRQRQVTAEDDRKRRSERDAEGLWAAAAAAGRASSNHAAEKSAACCGCPAQRRPCRHAATYSSGESQPIVVEDYVCSPGNFLSSERSRRVADMRCTTTANPTRGDGLYIPTKPGSKSTASTMFCCGGRGSATLQNDRPASMLSTSDVARRPKQPTNRTGNDTGRVAAAVSRSITELDRCDEEIGDDVGDRGRRLSSKPFQRPPNFVDASSATLANSRLPCDIARHQRALSRSLMDGIGRQPSRPTSGNFADRKQNSRMTSSTFAVDVATGRSSMLLEKSSDDLAARRPHRAPRSTSEDRQHGTGNRSRGRSPVAVGNGRVANNKSSRRSRETERTCSSALSRSLMAASTAPQHPTSSGAPAASSTSFHELPPRDRRRSSILQWSSASCGGREIFC